MSENPQKQMKKLKEKIRILENKLRGADKFKVIFYKANYGAAIVDLQGNILHVNNKFAKVHGYSSDELTGQNLNIFHTKEQLEMVRKVNDELMKTGSYKLQEIWHKKKNGATFPMLMTGQLLKGENGKPAYLSCTAIDISKQKKAENALKIMEEKIRDLAKFPEENVNPVFRISQEGALLYMNSSGKKLFAGDSELIVNNKISKKWQNKIKDIYKIAKPQTIETKIKNHFFSFTIMPIKNTRYLNVYGLDITERKQAKEELLEKQRLLVEAQRQAKLGSWEYNLVTNEIVWSDEVYTIFGLDKAKYTPSLEGLAKLMHPDDLWVVAPETIEKNTRAGIQDMEYRIIDQTTGKIKYVIGRGETHSDSEGKPIKNFGSFQDITDRKKAEEALLNAHQELTKKAKEVEKSNEELSQYASFVSHDLKTPLRAINNYSDYLVEEISDSLTGEQKKYIDGLQKAVNQANQLIEDLLELSSIGSNDEFKEAITTGKLIQEVIESEKLPQDIKVIMKDDFPKIHTDRVIFRQVFQNLIGNAVKFNDSRPKIIELGWFEKDDCYELFVKDNGIGIKPEYHQQIFKTFYRLHTKQEYDGTGTGLAIVKKAMDMLGGSVSLKSKPGDGSIFSIFIPK